MGSTTGSHTSVHSRPTLAPSLGGDATHADWLGGVGNLAAKVETHSLTGRDGGRRQVGRRYRLVRRIDEGGGGAVFEAFDEVRDRRVAAKRLHQRAIARREREVNAMRRLAVPGVVSLLDVVTEPDGTWLIMDFIEGLPFPGKLGEQALEAGDLSRLLKTTAALLDTLTEVHAQGLVHRDLKPDNVMVKQDGTPVLLDFGLARGSILGQTFTREGSVVGTPGYLAPEQVNAGRVDGRTDLYAVGTMLFEVLADRLPLPSSSTEQLYARTVRPAPSLALFRADLPRHIIETVDALLQIDLERRPTSALTVRSLLLHGRSLSEELLWLGSRVPIDCVVRALGKPGFVTVGGPAGCGRTRVVREVVAQLEAHGGTVQWLRPGRRPFESLVELVDLDDDTDPCEVRQAVTRSLDALMESGTVLLVDPLRALDPWTQRLLAGRDRILAVVDGPGTVSVAPMKPEVLRELFHGPDLILHLREDAAALLHRATGGVAARVEAVVRGWVRGGLAQWEDGRLRVRREDIDRLAFRLHGTTPAPVQDGIRIRTELVECLRWIGLAHPAATVPMLAIAMDRPAWQVALEVEDLVAAAHVVVVDGMLVPVSAADLRPAWSADRRRKAHGALASALSEHPEERLHHLLAAGLVDEVATVAATVAQRWLEEGRVGAAGAVLHDALLEVRSVPHVPGEARLLRLMLEVGVEARSKGAVEGAAVAIGKARRCDPVLKALADGARLLEQGRWAEASEVLRPWPKHELGWIARARGELLARSADQLGPTELESIVEELVGRVSLDPTPDAQAWRMRWQGRVAFRRYNFRKAADFYRRSADRSGSALGRARSLRLAAEASREAGDWKVASELARTARADAEKARHLVEAASALLVERTIVARAGWLEPARPDLVDIVAQIGRPSLTGRVASVESWIAFRQGDRDVARQLVEKARDWAHRGGITAAVVHCDALRVACSSHKFEDEYVADIIARTELLSRPGVTMDVLALLASVDRLPLGAVSRLEDSIEQFGSDAADVRRGVYSPNEAAGLVRRVLGR